MNNNKIMTKLITKTLNNNKNLNIKQILTNLNDNKIKTSLNDNKIVTNIINNESLNNNKKIIIKS